MPTFQAREKEHIIQKCVNHKVPVDMFLGPGVNSSAKLLNGFLRCLYGGSGGGVGASGGCLPKQ